MPPNASTVVVDRALEVLGIGEVALDGKRRRSASASRSRTSARRASMATLAPSAASASAIARPMPARRRRRCAVRPVRPRSMAAKATAAVLEWRLNADRCQAGLRPSSALECVRTETTSRTAASDTFSIFFSAAESRSFTISSAPPAPA